MLRVILAACILVGAGLAAQTVEGHVVNALTGDGIAGVTVFLMRQDGGIASTVITDSKGHFRVEGVQDGAYKAQYMDGVPLPRNFWPVPNSWDNGAQPFPFQVSSATGPVHLEAKMQPIGKLSGRVLDAAGKPVPGADLWLVSGGNGCKWPACIGFPYQSKTNEKGEYSIGDLRVPGAWQVSATAPASLSPPEPRDGERIGWAQTFYPGVTGSQGAAEVIVRPGGDTGNLDIKLAAVPVHRIRGMVVDIRGDPAPKIPVSLAKGFGPIVQQETKSDGTFGFASVADDEWRLSAAVKIGGVELRAVQWVQVKDDDLENVKLRLAAPFSIQGRVVMEVPEGTPAPKPPDVEVALAASDVLLSDPQRVLTSDHTDGKRDFTIEHVYPGQYAIKNFSDSPPEPYYLDSIRLGDRDFVQSGIPILSDAEPLTLTYKLGGGTVRGSIESCGGARVLLIPQDPALRGGYFLRATTCGQNGQFEFAAVRPGEYYGLAVMWDTPMLWYPAMLDDGLLRQASRVSVRANEATAAEIRLVTR